VRTVKAGLLLIGLLTVGALCCQFGGPFAAAVWAVFCFFLGELRQIFKEAPSE